MYRHSIFQIARTFAIFFFVNSLFCIFKSVLLFCALAILIALARNKAHVPTSVPYSWRMWINVVIPYKYIFTDPFKSESISWDCPPFCYDPNYAFSAMKKFDAAICAYLRTHLCSVMPIELLDNIVILKKPSSSVEVKRWISSGRIYWSSQRVPQHNDRGIGGHLNKNPPLELSSQGAHF